MAAVKNGDTLVRILEEFNFKLTLKKEQLAVINAVCEQKDVFAVLPTGFGKSMTYILAPLLMDKVNPGKLHTAVVISPLKALMADQVNILEGHGISAAAIIENTTVMDIKGKGHISVLFSSPEAAVLKKWQHLFKSELNRKVCVLVFDEAHCISSWGQDFRPSYRQVPVIQSYLEAPNLVLTATSTRKIQEDLFNLLGLDASKVDVVSILPDRPNIFLDISTSSENFEKELSWVLDYLSTERKKRKMILYVQSINKCSQIYMWLTTSILDNSRHNCFSGTISPENRRIEMYHSNTDNDSKERIMKQFIQEDGKLELLISTVAFGMGVNVPDIDCVVHWGSPSSTLKYWQEVGRCARDGRQGYAVCYAFKRSINKCETKSLKTLINEDTQCIRYGLLSEFLLDGMDPEHLKILENLEFCQGQCTDKCKCRKCRCCARCQKACQCEKKTCSPLESFLES